MRNLCKRGVTSITILLIMLVATTLLLSLAGMSMGTVTRSSNERDSSLAFNIAQAALEYQLSQSHDFAKNNVAGDFTAMVVDLSDLADSFTPGATAFVTIQPTGVPGRAWFTSLATYNGKRTSVRVLVAMKDVSMWNNAIFAGTGMSGKVINGNVEIRGSVHILGEGEYFSDLNGNGVRDDAEVFSDDNGNGVWDFGEPWVDSNGDGVWNSAEPYNDSNWNGLYDKPIESTELSGEFGGGAHIGNNYFEIPPEIEAMLPPLPVINGRETLQAVFRGRHGLVGLSGSATIGDLLDPDGGLSKGKMDGVFVTDGFSGDLGKLSVFSDNGASEPYDLDHLEFKFPFITGLGAEEYIDENGIAWDTHGLYLDNNSLTVPLNRIDADTVAFDYSDGDGNRFRYTPGGPKDPITGLPNPPPTMLIEGIIKIEGSFDFTETSAAGKTINEVRYAGRGTLYVTEDVNVHISLLPAAGLIFPTDTSLGMIAVHDINLAMGSGDSHLAMVGAFFAQGTIRSAKQNEIAGTFVSNYFDLGSNVPSIYQVPELAKGMPPAMPGDEPFISMKILSWRDRMVPNVPVTN